MKDKKVDVQQGLPPTDEDIFFLDWAKDDIKQNINSLNNTSSLFITINSALLSAYMVFFRELRTTIPNWVIIIPGGLLWGSLLLSIVSIFPFPKKVAINSPQDIQNYKQRRARTKTWLLIFAALFLLGAFLALLIIIFML